MICRLPLPGRCKLCVYVACLAGKAVCVMGTACGRRHKKNTPQLPSRFLLGPVLPLCLPPCEIHGVYMWRILQGGVCVYIGKNVMEQVVPNLPRDWPRLLVRGLIVWRRRHGGWVTAAGVQCSELFRHFPYYGKAEISVLECMTRLADVQPIMGHSGSASLARGEAARVCLEPRPEPQSRSLSLSDASAERPKARALASLARRNPVLHR
jgi:hypothetical protein